MNPNLSDKQFSPQQYLAEDAELHGGSQHGEQRRGVEVKRVGKVELRERARAQYGNPHLFGRN